MRNSLLFLIVCILAVSASAQPIIRQTRVIAEHVNFRTPEAVVLDSITIHAPDDGQVFVRFEGNCISDVRDRITLAASSFHGWIPNDGNTSAEAFDSLHTLSCFSHTRYFPVTAGARTFYAVGQNWVNQIGSGIASIDGVLTVEFIPNQRQDLGLSATGIVHGPINWPAPILTMKTVTIEAPVQGRILVSFDGKFFMKHNERALLTTNLSSAWPAHSEVTEMFMSEGHNNSSFIHRRIYEVAAGVYEIHALGNKIQGVLNNSSDYMYATLSAQFVADDSDIVSVESISIQDEEVIHGIPGSIGQIAVTAPAPGYILLQYSGQSISSIDDKLILSLTPENLPDSILGKIIIQPVQEVNPYTTFSVSGLTEVPAGTHIYDVIADFDQNSAGTGIGELSGFFTAQYFANPVISSVNDSDFRISAVCFPNPTTGILNGYLETSMADNSCDLAIYNISGHLVRFLPHIEPGMFSEDIGSLPDGEYVLKIRQGNAETSQVIVKKSN